MKRVGVILARMQPVHNAHLFLVRKAIEECDMVLIVLGSENKFNTLRNPYAISIRESMLRECFSEEENQKIIITTLPDWSTESDTDNAKIWGRYFYYNVVSRIGQKRFSLYYSDDVSILDSWFEDTEVRQYIYYRTFDRSNIFDGLSATKIRQAFLNDDIEYIKKFCPASVVERYDFLASCYKEIYKHPEDDYSME